MLVGAVRVGDQDMPVAGCRVIAGEGDLTVRTGIFRLGCLRGSRDGERGCCEREYGNLPQRSTPDPLVRLLSLRMESPFIPHGVHGHSEPQTIPRGRKSE